MGDWKQEEYPKRMAAEIKKVKEQRRIAQQATIKAAAAHVTAELARPSYPFRRPAPQNVPRPRRSKTRVAAIQEPHPMMQMFPYTGTKRARRYLRKHPGVPVEQHPHKPSISEVASGN
jgi:hypothetical protein